MSEDNSLINKTEGYSFEPACKVCSSTDSEGESLRDMADALAIRGRSYSEVAEYLTVHGQEDFSKKNVYDHVRKHSPYVREAKEAGSRASSIIKLHSMQKTADAEEVLDKIISAGDKMIDNWLENKTGEKKMEITDKMFMDAIKEKGRRGTVNTMDMILLQMDEEFINERKPKISDKQSTRTISPELEPSEE